MSRPAKDTLERLGADGLARVLDDVLDQTRLARLASACGLSYPGIRTRSQKRERILADLVARAQSEDVARRAILHALAKETAPKARAWSKLTSEEREKRLADETASADKLGLHLFLVASATDGPEGDSLLRKLQATLATRSARASDVHPAALESSRKEVARLKKKNAELLKKVRHLDNQLAKSRESEKALKKDLMGRKGELAEARMLNERLRSAAEKSKGAGASSPAEDPDWSSRLKAEFDGVSKSLRKLATEQRRLGHALAKKTDEPAPQVTVPPRTLAPVRKALEEMTEANETLRQTWAKDTRDRNRRLEKLRAEVGVIRDALEAGPRTPRRKGETERVGVFVDVQNMYYAARQLKGKLDFDALMQAAVLDRRLIQATAYVVESKDTDQSDFIALLQKRAITVRRKPLKVRSDGSMKGDWDMEMALDILDAASSLDVVVLVSGDGDFTSLVNRVKEMGPRVEVLGFPRNTSKSLLESADRFQPLDRKFMIRTEPEPAKSGKRRPSADSTAKDKDRKGDKPASDGSA